MTFKMDTRQQDGVTIVLCSGRITLAMRQTRCVTGLRDC